LRCQLIVAWASVWECPLNDLDRLRGLTNTQTIYVELRDEGVVVYRPVEATTDPDGVRRLPPTAPADEHG
jgi:hypothetical protein